MYTGSDFQLYRTMSNRCFGITIKEDNDPEPTEQFNISFSVNFVQVDGVNINNFSEAIIFIQDDDGKKYCKGYVHSQFVCYTIILQNTAHMWCILQIFQKGVGHSFKSYICHLLNLAEQIDPDWVKNRASST